MDPVLEAIYESVIDGAQKITQTKVNEALESGLKAEVILNEGLVNAMAEVGKLFEEGEFFVPEMLIAARAMQAGLSILKPILVAEDFKPIGKVAAGTVKGDLHDIGKNLVCMMLEGASFEIVDLGTDVKPEQFVAAVKEDGCNIICMSALLTTTMSNMKATIDALETAGIRDSVTVLVGGAPLTDSYANEIGADGYASDASQAVAVAKNLIA
ncbi:MAG: corrinoid protein [Anaerolineaceae bacterium]|nr:corrinoid protein [Anaerolineaceae bacterium]